jgi:hypothetical protein
MCLTHPVNFPCGRELEFSEFPRLSAERWLFTLFTWGGLGSSHIEKFSLRFEPATLGKCANHFATEAPSMPILGIAISSNSPDQTNLANVRLYPCMFTTDKTYRILFLKSSYLYSSYDSVKSKMINYADVLHLLIYLCLLLADDTCKKSSRHITFNWCYVICSW